MRRILFVIAALVTAGTVHAGEAERFFSERVKDFGAVPFGPTLVHQFKITNTSSQTVYIAGARVSCGCVTATVAANTLRPGEVTVLTASMDTKRFSGFKEVTVYVSFTHPREEVTLAVRGNRNDNFSRSADSIEVGQVRKGAAGSASIQVTMRNDPRFEIKNVQSVTDYVQPSFSQVRRDRNEVVYEVTAHLKPGLDLGSWVTELEVTTSNASLARLRIPVHADVVASITATPSTVQFPAVKVGDRKEVSVVVKGDKPFKILDVKGGDGMIRAESDRADARAAHILRLVFEPNAAGELAETITVVTDGDQGQLIIPVRGKAR